MNIVRKDGVLRYVCCFGDFCMGWIGSDDYGKMKVIWFDLTFWNLFLISSGPLLLFGLF